MLDYQSSVSLKVYLEDTDAGGVVYHANYLKYLERARTEFIKHYGLGRRYMLEHGIIFVVRQIKVAYKQPAYLDDELVATAKLTKLHKFAATFGQEVCRNSDAKLLCSATAEVVCLEPAKHKLRQLPEELLTK